MISIQTDVSPLYGSTAVQRGAETGRSKILSSIFSDEHLQENRIQMLMRRVQCAEAIFHDPRVPTSAPSGEAAMKKLAT
jgi:hypothetical protein